MPAPGGEVLMVILFKLKKGVGLEEWLEASGPVLQWASEQPGFIKANQYYDPEAETWVDVEYWESKEQCVAHLDQVRHVEGNQAMFALMDDEGMNDPMYFAYDPASLMARPGA